MREMRFNFIVHDHPNFQLDPELLSEEGQEVRVATRNSGLADSDSKAGTQGRQLRQVVVAAEREQLSRQA